MKEARLRSIAPTRVTILNSIFGTSSADEPEKEGATRVRTWVNGNQVSSQNPL